MVDFYRVGAGLLAVATVGMLFSGPAHAASGYILSEYDVAGHPLQGTPAAACAQAGLVLAAINSATYSFSLRSSAVNAQGNCDVAYSYTRKDNGASDNGTEVISIVSRDGYSPPAPAVDPATANQQAVDAVNALYVQLSFQSPTSSPNLHVCFNGQAMHGAFSACYGNSCSVTAPFSGDGGPCTPGTPVGSAGGVSGVSPGSTPVPADATPTNCASGQFGGTVNGLAVCVNAAKGNTVSLTQKTSSGGTSSDDPAKPSTTTSGTESTICRGADCVTTTTTSSSSGSGAPVKTTESKTEPKEDFCTKNPRSAQCVTSSYGASVCSAGAPSCDGDAIQCAVARQTFEAKCSVSSLDSAPGYGDVALAAAGVSNPSDSPANSANQRSVNVTSLIVKTNPFNSACPVDYSITIPRVGPLVIPLTAYCGAFQNLGKLLLGLALFSGAIIIAKRD